MWADEVREGGAGGRARVAPVWRRSWKCRSGRPAASRAGQNALWRL